MPGERRMRVGGVDGRALDAQALRWSVAQDGVERGRDELLVQAGTKHVWGMRRATSAVQADEHAPLLAMVSRWGRRSVACECVHVGVFVRAAQRAACGKMGYSPY